MVWVGATTCEVLPDTEPTPSSMDKLVAPVTVQLSVLVCPGEIVVGEAVKLMILGMSPAAVVPPALVLPALPVAVAVLVLPAVPLTVLPPPAITPPAAAVVVAPPAPPVASVPPAGIAPPAAVAPSLFATASVAAIASLLPGIPESCDGGALLDEPVLPPEGATAVEPPA